MTDSITGYGELVVAGVGVFGTVLGTVVGYLLNEWTRRRQEKDARRARLNAVGVEVERCGEMLRTFLQHNVAAPLYRLPTWAGEKAFGQLATDGTLGRAAVQSLLRYYTNISEINRGLERAGAAASASDNSQLQKEFGRLSSLKVPAILNPENPGDLSLQERVERAIEGALKAL
jgi:hypothetical protein